MDPDLNEVKLHPLSVLGSESLGPRPSASRPQISSWGGGSGENPISHILSVQVPKLALLLCPKFMYFPEIFDMLLISLIDLPTYLLALFVTHPIAEALC